MSTPPPLPHAPPAELVGRMCQNHPQMPAAHLCQGCGAAVCITCDFALPGGVHLCPNCAVTPRGGLTGKRKGLLVWALLLAVVTTVGLGLVFSMPMDEEAAGAVFVGLFITGVIGGALGISCFERRMGNPPIVWVAGIWNIVLLAVLVLLVIVGNLMEA